MSDGLSYPCDDCGHSLRDHLVVVSGVMPCKRDGCPCKGMVVLFSKATSAADDGGTGE